MSAPAVEMVTWGELHAGDQILGADGKVWEIDQRAAVDDVRWLASSTSGRADMFTVRCVDGGRTIKATRPLADRAARTRASDRGEIDAASSALAGAGFTIIILREGREDMTTETPAAPAPLKPNPCQHDPSKLSTLRTGAVFCTDCFDTITPAITSPEAHAIATAAATPAAVVPPTPEPLTGNEPIGTEVVVDGIPFVKIGNDPFNAPTPTPVAVTTVTENDHLADPAPEPVEADVFRDPAANEHLDVPRDRWGRYKLPHPMTGIEQPWTRASTLARVLADEYNLVGWKLRQVARGVAMSPDLIAGILAADPEDKKTLDNLVRQASERAASQAGANLGTALHNFTHRLDRGESVEALRAPAPLDRDLTAYRAELKRQGFGVVPELIERIVVCPALNAAGTFDRILTQRPGHASPCQLTIGDLKTAKSLEYSWLEIAIQLAIYANATHMYDLRTRTYIPMPPSHVLDRDRAIVLHVPIGKAQGSTWAVNIREGWEAAKVAEQARQYRNSAKGYGWLVEPDPVTLLLHRVSTADQAELARLWNVHHPRGEWTDEVNNAALARAARLAVVPTP